MYFVRLDMPAPAVHDWSSVLEQQAVRLRAAHASLQETGCLELTALEQRAAKARQARKATPELQEHAVLLARQPNQCGLESGLRNRQCHDADAAEAVFKAAVLDLGLREREAAASAAATAARYQPAVLSDTRWRLRALAPCLGLLEADEPRAFFLRYAEHAREVNARGADVFVASAPKPVPVAMAPVKVPIVSAARAPTSVNRGERRG